ncbi:D-alanine--poly(phosphoribitol) ligase subunit 2 [Streptomyces sp. YIM 130001]|uniref:acyl carrier protein n=1 Tax=Streptomyces sp. YIM 130001 TaxID=2259644 RepID=UPI000EBA1A83|nr:acyl carrier protein [Streptomyces sp. YIM 130001]RII13767.1 D-alanine--poly(phosphoribitol) ligase subunit 2 [Streptomyces sp. YIM 130001]
MNGTTPDLGSTGTGTAGALPDPELITERITGFLTASLRVSVGPDDDYFAQGLANSLFSLELVTFVEDTFGLTVEVEDLNLDSFRTARRVTDFVLSKAGPGTGEAHADAV